MLLGELRYEWGLQQRAAPLQIYYFLINWGQKVNGTC